MNVARLHKADLAAHVASVQFCGLNLPADKLHFFAVFLEQKCTKKQLFVRLKAAETIVRDETGQQIQPIKVRP